MINIRDTLDLIKLQFYNEWIYATHIPDQGESEFHKQITEKVIPEYIDPIDLPKDSVIVDINCGPGYFLDEMTKRGYSNLTGVTLNSSHTAICKEKGYNIKSYDPSFLPQKDGYYDESVDFLFLRHVIENSPYPIFTLMEYNRVLKQGGKMFLEVISPEGEYPHELNTNHFSIMTSKQLMALLTRTGFNIDQFNSFDFDLSVGSNEDGTPKYVKEKYYVIVVTKKRPMDVK